MGIRYEFKEMMRNFLRWINTEGVEPAYAADSAMPVSNKKTSLKGYGSNSASSSEDLGLGLNFTVFSATGGKVVKVHSYDPRLDRTTSGLHIITDKEDLGEELGQIITRENLTR